MLKNLQKEDNKRLQKKADKLEEEIETQEKLLFSNLNELPQIQTELDMQDEDSGLAFASLSVSKVHFFYSWYIHKFDIYVKEASKGK